MLVWQESGPRAPSRSRRYTQSAPNFPVGEWATDELSQVYDRVDDVVREQQVQARTNIMAASRVDTGLMRSLVESTVATPGETFVMEFGWWSGVPHYAPYQEFGTMYIEPMLAVQREYVRVPLEILDAVIP